MLNHILCSTARYRLYDLQCLKKAASCRLNNFHNFGGLSIAHLRSMPLCTKVDSIKDHSCLGFQKTYHEIYRFPAIRIGFYLHKLKWYQTLAVSAAIPASALFYLVGVISSDLLISIAVPGILLTSNLYGYAYIFDRVIGFIYLSEDEQTVKISYLDFWGNRINEEYPVEDIMPFCDAPRPPTDFLFKSIIFYPTDKVKLKLYLKFGKITDSNKFTKVFGSDK